MHFAQALARLAHSWPLMRHEDTEYWLGRNGEKIEAGECYDNMAALMGALERLLGMGECSGSTYPPRQNEE